MYQHLDKFKETNFLDEFEFFLENELKTSYIVLDDGGLILSEDDFLVDMFCLSNIDQFSQNIVLGDIFCLFQSYYYFFNLKCEEFRFLKKYNKRKVKKKLRMKRLKRVRKFRIFKKLLKRKKTIIKLKKFRPQSCITYKKTKKSKPIHLFQKLTLTPRMIQNVNLFFFYKLNSHALDDFNEFTNNLEEHSTGVDDFKKFKIMLRNYHRKPY